ncbi:MAG: hypothetical protein GF411_13790 [Candidatus Lokiarchaeota archaeon]|nr:hypothetical protein [Candidatus Lokiarchaeota archaeon]
MKYILGSGLIAFIAKKMLPEYQIIPSGKSRFYQYDIATCDDYIVCHPDVDDVIQNICGKFIPVFFKRAFSLGGDLLFAQNNAFASMWLKKSYGEFADYAPSLIKMDMFIYNISGTNIFKRIEKECIKTCADAIRNEERIESIDLQQKKLILKSPNGKRMVEYDHIINTLPLNVLFKLCNIDIELSSKDLHTCVLATDDFDFEGATEVLIVDDYIDFIKCTCLGKNIYQLFYTTDIPQLSSYLQLMIKKFKLINGTCVRNSIPCGMPSDYNFDDFGIKNVGSLAQWDDLIDLSTCIRILTQI